jgi:hypothetical protein
MRPISADLIRGIALLGALAVAGGDARAATTWDAATVFKDMQYACQNQSYRTWTWGSTWDHDLDGCADRFVLMDLCANETFYISYPSTAIFMPTFYLRLTDDSQDEARIWYNYGGPYPYYTHLGIAPRELALHPGDSDDYGQNAATIRFTAPGAGLYTVNATFGAGDTGEVYASVVLNGDWAECDTDAHELWSSLPWTDADDVAQTSLTFSEEYAFEGGETLDFSVFPKSGGDYDTPIAITITYEADIDGDGVPDSTDVCPYDAATVDLNHDGCQDAVVDTDGDGLPDASDACPLEAPVTDTDGDGCEDVVDSDNDGVADGADQCPHVPAVLDTNHNGCQDCSGYERSGDNDLDGYCNDVDLCWGDDATGDPDADWLCGDLDACPTEPRVTNDFNGNGCEDCTGDDTTGDHDGDSFCDDVDLCVGSDPSGDEDLDGICLSDDACFGDDTTGDSDGDSFCDDVDLCVGWDQSGDTDLDGVCNSQDLCTGDDATGDSDGDHFCDDVDLCVGWDQSGDEDADGLCLSNDACVGDNASGDTDVDGVCDDRDACPGAVDELDADSDAVPDDCDACPGFDDAADADADGVADGCDTCPGDDDADDDGACSATDTCPSLYNPGQVDLDGDGEGDECDDDDDGDGVDDALDNCTLDANPDQDDADWDGAGDVCDASESTDVIVNTVELDVIDAVAILVALDTLPDANGLVAKLQKVSMLVSASDDAYLAGTIGQARYLRMLDRALLRLDAFDEQLEVKAASTNKKNRVPSAAADELRGLSAEIRLAIEALIDLA